MKMLGTNLFFVRHNNNSNSENRLFQTKLSNISQDMVCFKANSTVEKSNWINKSVGDKILNLIKKYPFENLEFINQDNDLVYALRTLPKLGFIYVYKQNILDDKLDFFSAGVHYPSIKSKLNAEGEYSESNNNQFIWEFGGNQFSNPYSGEEIKPIKFNFAQTARQVESIYQEILDNVENGNIIACNGDLPSHVKLYDDLEETRRKNKLRIAAFHTLLRQKQPKDATNKGVTLVDNAENFSTETPLTSFEKPTRKEIDAIVQKFLLQKTLIDQNNKRKKLLNSSTDSEKYKRALEKQRQERLKEESINSIQKNIKENTENTGLILDRTGIFSTRKDSTPENDFPNKADITNIHRRKRRKPITKEDILFGAPIDPDSDTAKFFRATRKQKEINEAFISESLDNNRPTYGKVLDKTDIFAARKATTPEHYFPDKAEVRNIQGNRNLDKERISESS